jgi:hypothetical protein
MSTSHPATIILASLVVLFGGARTAQAAKEMRLQLRFTPKENVTANLPKSDGVNPAVPIEILPLIDSRSLPDLSLVGENREHSTPKPVRATSSVAAFATDVLKRCLDRWGVRVGPSGAVLRGEITNLFVTEENTYSTAVNIRFRLEKPVGTVIWEGIASGDAHQWGRSFAEENYNEQISDALKRTYATLLDNPSFQIAWEGRASQHGVFTITPAAMKTKILDLMKEGIGTEVIVRYVRGVRIYPPLNPDELIDWKRSAIPEPVIEAALPGSSTDSKSRR